MKGAALKKMEDEKGIVVRFIIGRSANQGDSLDRAIINENRQTNDFIILNDHVEAPEELPKKTKLFFAHAADNWDAEFYAKVNDDVYVNIDALVTTLEAHLQVSRTYIGCMKSGEVFSDVGHKWYESDWWKFGDGKSSLIRTYAHDDVSVGSWFIGLNVEYVHEPKFCCSSWTSGIVSRSSSNVPFYLSVSSLRLSQGPSGSILGPYVPAFDSSCLVILRRNYKAEIYCGHWTVHANQ
ncbi:Hydroxyproline O-galactosyltransferase HPGT1 [Vitis vinifera]|uniref:Hexosyltransferase n=1 Tax=Vitis vinifera TaxID=29760 RepID=A0A438ID47_VITVI|nr:Hydroxyproline O-galactosyltransferase HPGT1 [Vitis vinifera]